MATTAASFCYFYTRKTVEKNIYSQLEIAADSLQEKIRLFLQEKMNRTLDFSSDGFMRGYAEEITGEKSRKEYYSATLTNHLVTNKKSLDPDILEVFVVDLNGKVIASTDKGHVGKDVSGEECFTKAEFLSSYAGDPRYDTYLKEIVVDFSTVLLSKIGREAIGIIVNRIKFGQQENQSQDITIPIQSNELEYFILIVANKVRIVDFSSDGFIRDCTEELTRRDDRVSYYSDILNTQLAINKKPLDPDILSIFIVDFSGKIIASTEIGTIGKDISGEVYFKETMRSGSYISDIHHSAGLKQVTFEVARKLFDKDNKNPIALIVNRYNGNSLTRITRSGIKEELEQTKQLKELGETGEVYIVNSNKAMITESRFIKDAILKQVVDTEGVRAAFDNGLGTIGIYPDYRDVPTLGVSRYIEDMDWVVLAEKDVSEAFAPLVRLKNITISMGIGGILVVVIIAIFLATGITGPVNELVEGTRRISKGDLTYKIEVQSRDEIGLLATAFNKMTENLVATTVSRDYVENIMRSMIESIIVVSPDGTIEIVNNAACGLLGYIEEELVNKHIKTLFEEEEEEEEEEEFFKKSGIEDLVKKGFITNVEKTFITKDGKRIPVLFSGSVMRGQSDSGSRTSSGLSRSEYIAGRDEKCRIQGIVCVATDITKRKQTEVQIRMLSRAVEQSPSTVMITDAKGNIEYVNPKFTQLAGYSFEEVVGKNPRILKSGKQSEEVYKQLWDTITSGREWHGELHNKKKNGQLYWESALIFPIKNQDEAITHFIALKEDITEGKRLEKEKQDMEMKMLASSKLATLGEMAAGVAHEINQPLTYISGTIQGIREDFEINDVDRENTMKTLEKSRRQVERINQIIQHLCIFGRASDVEMRDVIIGKVLDNTLLLLGEKMRLLNIDFICKEDDVMPLVKGNESQLEQVFINLIQNSIYAIKEKGYKNRKIMVAIKKMKEKNGIQIDYFDNGKGIAPEHLEKIFNPFFTTKPVGKGTGLGLSILHSIIQSHGGEITCKSKVGKGTTFSITLPAV